MVSDEVKKDKAAATDKKAKRDKKRSESDGVHKNKKDKKKEKAKQEKLARALDTHIQTEGAEATTTATASTKTTKPRAIDPEDLVKPTDELVPFALPLADDKTHKKIYKLIKKGAKLKAVHRGVKECEKAIKKCPLEKGNSTSTPPGLVVIAGDISPMDVIMHFPILCEEHGIPYIYIRSRADLGVAACTKRATSVVMLRPEGKKPTAAGKGAGKDEEEEMDAAAADDGTKVSTEEYLESWKELLKLAEKQWTIQVEPWVKGTHPLQIAAKALLTST